jgi:hypothetical protein
MDSSWILSILQSFLTPYTLQFLSACALLATVVINLIYSRKQFKEMQKQTEALQKQVEELQKKPELDVKFDYSWLDFGDTIGFSIGEVVVNYKTVRVKVSNVGSATAEECVAKAEIMAYESPKHKEARDAVSSEKSASFRLVETTILHWTRNLDTTILKILEFEFDNIASIMLNLKDDEVERLFKPISIAVNDYELADLIIIGASGLVNEIYESSRYSMIRCNLNPIILPINDNLALNEGEIIKVTVYCRNATSKSLCLKVKKIPIYDDISSSNKDKYFEEIECPKLES